MRYTNSEIAEKIKKELVKMTVEETLPSDMTTLDVSFIMDILENRDKFLKDNSYYKKAEQYLLVVGDNPMNVRQQVDCIIEINNKYDMTLIDFVSGVHVISQYEYTFTCREFLYIIGYNGK